MTRDGRKGLEISCNCLNLPSHAETADGSSLTYTYLADGTKVSAVSGCGYGLKYRGSFVYETGDSMDDYLPFGTRVQNASFAGVEDNRYRYAGKEEQRIGGADLSLLDFGARYYDPYIARWTSIDPMAHQYFTMTPNGYCGSNPVNVVDTDGNAWLPVTNEGGEFDYLWIPEDLSYNEDGALKEGLYHQAILFTDNHTFDKKTRYNLGSSTAIVYTSDGSKQIFDACTIPSDAEKYPTVPAGRYEAAVGSHNGKYTALKMFNVGKNIGNNIISLGEPNVAFPERDYIECANIHKAGSNDLTGMANDGRPVSAACFLISRNEVTWNSFIGLFNNKEQKKNIISISVMR